MIFRDDAFKGKLVVITGASSGIGRSTATLLSRLEARVVIVGRDEPRLVSTLESLMPGNHVIRMGDVSDTDSTAKLIEEISSEIGEISGIFHSAGSSIVLPARLTRNKHLDDVFGAGFRGAFGIAQACCRRGVMSDGGSIVLMSSISSIRGRQGLAAYSAAKAAVDGMVRVLAIELATRRIRINSICAGAVRTEMHERFVNSMNSEIIEAYERLHPLGFGSAEDVSSAAVYLLSSAAPWITGTSLIVDGGYAAR